MGLLGKIAGVAKKVATKYNPVAAPIQAAYGAGKALAHGDIAGAGKAVASSFVPAPAMGAISAGTNVARGNYGEAAKDLANGYVPGSGDYGQLLGEGAIAAGKAIGSGFGALKKEYDAPYDEAANATGAAGQKASDLGQEQKDFYLGGLDRAQGEYGQAQDVYGQTVGDLTPGAYEQHMQDSMAGKNAYYDQARTSGQKGLDSAFAARGIGNSGAALEASAKMNAQLGAEQARDLEGIAKTGQEFQNTQKQKAFEGAMGLGGAKADLTSGFYGKAGDSYESGKLAGINADLAKAQIGLQKRRDTLGLVSGLAGDVVGAIV
jgi:hypothetical protein